MEQFEKWLVQFNKIYGENIKLKGKFAQKGWLNDSWLSGFTDAEGCFTVSTISRSSNYIQVQIRYILSQKGEEELLWSIGEEVEGRVAKVKSYGGHNMVVNYKKLGRIIKYIQKYPLQTKKKVDYLNWLKIYNLVEKKEHRNQGGLETIQKIKVKINR